MARETERFNRALQKFLDDNPDIDFDKAKDEFIELYNSGEYKLDDDFSKADDLYLEALKLEDSKLVIDALKKALNICPKHFEAKGELIILESKTEDEKIMRLKALLNENRDDLEANEEIDLNNFERSLWLNIDVRPYLRNMFKLMMIYFNNLRYEEANIIGKELLRLDPENHQNQTIFYLISLLGLEKYDEVLNDSNEFFKLDKQAKYLFISFLAALYKKDIKEAKRYIAEAVKYNGSYLCIILGIARLSNEDYSHIFDLNYVEEDPFEDAARNIFCISRLIDDHISSLEEFIDNEGAYLVKLIDPDKKGMELLFVLEAKREATLKEILQAISQLKDDVDFAGLKSLSEAEIRKELIKLKNFKYLQYYDSKYVMTFLGYSVLGFFVGDGNDDNN